jgi:methionine biosynthesis protein MetW
MTSYSQPLRPDLARIAANIAPRSRVLDVGCGDGDLLGFLESEKGCDARGIELSRDGVNRCLAKGLSVVQGDADDDLGDYPTNGFDVAVLSQTVQATRAPAQVVKNLLRIAPLAMVSFPNFGHWRVRLSLLFNGRMPVTQTLPVSWHETPNIHLCTVKDFAAMTQEIGAQIKSIHSENGNANAAHLRRVNLLSSNAMFVLERG